MSADLAGKVIAITGGGSGLGRAASRIAAQGGAALVLGDLNKDGLDVSADAILSDGGNVSTLEMDVRNADDCQRLAALALEKYARLDGAVCGAGVSGDVPVMDMTLQEWQRVIDINLTGVFISTQALARAMIQAGNGGSLVTITSDLAIRGRPTAAHYVAAKAGVIGLTKSFALALAADNIRVNALAPGITDTPLARAGRTQKQMDERARAVPFGRIGQPEEIGDVICFLLSDASRWMTGQTVYVNGGMVMP
jgi:NAD(P)-dependent dehydrogenase (short-subunit alcohol dehydrogenase family)